MNFNKAVDWLYSFQKFGMKPGLERINFLVDKLGNPQKNYKIIHVGGTNGKGSVCKFIGSILTCCGYNVGVYTSPHLQHISERITINDIEISDQDFIKMVNRIKPIVDEIKREEDYPTFFEIITAIAFQYFDEKKVDFAVVEVGLGGRFDATNIVDPCLSVITNVSLEHKDVLGKTVEKIAFEKAGIIKKEIPVITAAQEKALSVIEKVAKEKNASLTQVDNKLWKRNYSNIKVQEFIVKGNLKDYNIQTGILGEHQGENIALSLYTIEQLQLNGVFLTDECITEGIEKTFNIGRMELINTEPFILLDGAHNPSGIKNLVKSLKNDFTFNRLICVLGILSDKDIKSMISEIAPISDIIIVTKSSNERACPPKQLMDLILQFDKKKNVVIKEKIPDAIDYAKSIAKKDDLICVTGSLFTVGEARDYLF